MIVDRVRINLKERKCLRGDVSASSLASATSDEMRSTITNIKAMDTFLLETISSLKI